METIDLNTYDDNELLEFLSKEENLKQLGDKEINRKANIKQTVVNLPKEITERLENILGKKGITWNKTTILMLTKNKLQKIIKEPTKAPENYEQIKRKFIHTQKAKLQQGVESGEITLDPHYFEHTQSDANRKKGNSIEEVLKAIRGFDQNFTAKGETIHERKKINQKYMVLDPDKLEHFPKILDLILHQKIEKGYTHDQIRILVHEVMQNSTRFIENFFNNHQKISISTKDITNEIKNRQRSFSRIRKEFDIEIPQFTSEKILNDRIIRFKDKQENPIYIRSRNPNYIYPEKYKSKYQGRRGILELHTDKETLIKQLFTEAESNKRQIQEIRLDTTNLGHWKYELEHCQDTNEWKEIVENAIQYGQQKKYPFRQDITKTMTEIKEMKYINRGNIAKKMEALEKKAEKRIQTAVSISGYLNAYLIELNKNHRENKK